MRLQGEARRRGQRGRAARALVAEARASLLPLALGAPEVAVLHAVHLAALLVVGARPAARAARGPRGARQAHQLLRITKRTPSLTMPLHLATMHCNVIWLQCQRNLPTNSMYIFMCLPVNVNLTRNALRECLWALQIHSVAAADLACK